MPLSLSFVQGGSIISYCHRCLYHYLLIWISVLLSLVLGVRFIFSGSSIGGCIIFRISLVLSCRCYYLLAYVSLLSCPVLEVSILFKVSAPLSFALEIKIISCPRCQYHNILYQVSSYLLSPLLPHLLSSPPTYLCVTCSEWQCGEYDL